jgi:NAD(P)-dependent dehydrogenase (short-subunit alcohol dehydrogenase family)
MGSDRFNLSGRNALITGAAGLLGVEHAAAIIESDGNVILSDISKRGLVVARQKLTELFPNAKIESIVMDVSSPTSILKASERLLSQGLNVDILINNAAIDPKVVSDSDGSDASRLENFTLEQWNLEITVGLTGAFLCSKVFGSLMAMGGKGGVIINVASDLSVIAPNQDLYRVYGIANEFQPVKPVTYSVIKAGLVGLTRYLATYWPNSGVRANSLSPGGVLNGQGDEFVRRISSLIPMGRMAERDEYRAAIQFLCSDASSYMNGQNLVIDGGRSVW